MPSRLLVGLLASTSSALRHAELPAHLHTRRRHPATCVGGGARLPLQRRTDRVVRHASVRAQSSAAPAEAKDPFYVTTPIYYVNGAPHIGHVYTTLACDVVARFKRLDGHEVKFLTGTDEHGQKVEQSARAAGETPIAFADRVSASFREMLSHYNFSCDEFIRTTE